MSDDRPWYREPETFIAVAALVVSITAVVVGVYEAKLQRAHDRAEVWPHLEVGTFTSPNGVAIKLQNTGIGPGIVKSIIITVDGKPMHNWPEALERLTGTTPKLNENYTVANSAIRAGDGITLIGLQRSALPPGFDEYGQRVLVRICYTSVFDDAWQLTARIEQGDEWQTVARCGSQPKGMEF